MRIAIVGSSTMAMSIARLAAQSHDGELIVVESLNTAADAFSNEIPHIIESWRPAPLRVCEPDNIRKPTCKKHHEYEMYPAEDNGNLIEWKCTHCGKPLY